MSNFGFLNKQQRRGIEIGNVSSTTSSLSSPIPGTPIEINRKRDNDNTSTETKKRLKYIDISPNKIISSNNNNDDYDDNDSVKRDDDIDRYFNTQNTEYTINGTRLSKSSTHADIVHGNIVVDELCSRIIDTPEFKRLTRLNQLGVCFEVFRCANHTRFVHSLGVMHLANKVVTRLKQNQPELNITDNDVLCVKIAALCHDLGHGPYSHVFDGVIIPKKYKGNPNWENWKHEEQSVILLKYLLKVNKIDLAMYGLTKIDETFIYEIIIGDDKNRVGRSPDKYYLYDIVNNTRSSLDVDKLDYFQRDMQHTNVQFQSKKSFERFIESGKVMLAAPLCIDDKNGNKYRAEDVKADWPIMMCYPQKMVNDALEFFQTRFKMHNTVYTHKVVKAIEYMYTDAILLADPYIFIRGEKNAEHPDGKYKITECIMDAEAYSQLDDNIISLIKMSTLDVPDIKKANAILDRIARRELYKCVGKVKFDRIVTDKNIKDIFPMKEDEIKKEILQTEIFNSQLKTNDSYNDILYKEISNDGYSNCGFPSISGPALNIGLAEDDFIVEKWHTHHGQKQNNPVSNLRFFVPSTKSGKLEVGVHLKENKYDNCIPPKAFEMFAVRVFVKDKEKIDIVRRKFHAWCQEKRNESPTQYLSSQPYIDEQNDNEIDRLVHHNENNDYDEDDDKFNLDLE